MSLRNVNFSYRERSGLFSFETIHVVDDLSLDVYEGESLGILGRNGAGKSTLLKLFAGIVKADSGEFHRYTASITLLTLGGGFDGRLSGRFNVMIAGMLLGFSAYEIKERMDAIIEYADIGDAIDRPVRSYSSGMRARLGFSVANILEPEILLIDEVLGVGDVDFRAKSRAAMRAKIAAGQTVVLVSHNVNAIRNLCDRALLIDQGRVVVSGDVETVIAEYESGATNR